MEPVTIDLCGYDKIDGAGGPVVWLCRFPAVLRELGINVRVRLLSWDPPEEGIVYQTLTKQGFNVSGTEFKDTDSNIRWIIDQVSCDPPDVFVPNLVTPAFYAARWIRAAGIPTVGILHSDDEFYHSIQDEFIFGEPSFAVSSVVCVSQELQQQVAGRSPSTTIPIRIPYGVPTPENNAELNGLGLRLAFVGRLAEEQKCISQVTRAFCRAVTEVSGTTATIFGDGPDKPNVERILNTEGAGLPIVLAGNVPSDEIQQKLTETSDVIVLLSDYEGLPISLLEAMACGIVPVCLNIRSGIPELIEHDVTGVLVNDREDAFVNAIRKLNDSPSTWQRLSIAAREQVRSQNSLHAAAEKWAELLRSLKAQCTQKTAITLPAQLKLPPVNAALAREDGRITRQQLGLYERTRTLMGSIKRKFVRE